MNFDFLNQRGAAKFSEEGEQKKIQEFVCNTAHRGNEQKGKTMRD